MDKIGDPTLLEGVDPDLVGMLTEHVYELEDRATVRQRAVYATTMGVSIFSDLDTPLHLGLWRPAQKEKLRRGRRRPQKEKLCRPRSAPRSRRAAGSKRMRWQRPRAQQRFCAVTTWAARMLLSVARDDGAGSMCMCVVGPYVRR